MVHPEKLCGHLVGRWHEEAERNQVFPLDDSNANRMAHMAMPWAEFRGRDHYACRVTRCTRAAGRSSLRRVRHRRAVHRAARTPHRRHDPRAGRLDLRARVPVCVAGDLLLVQSSDGIVERTRALSRPGAHVLRAWATPCDPGGGFTTGLAADDAVLATGELRHLPTVRAPDGVFLTVGYSRPFPVTDDYAPPFAAPASFAGVTISVGPLSGRSTSRPSSCCSAPPVNARCAGRAAARAPASAPVGRAC